MLKAYCPIYTEVHRSLRICLELLSGLSVTVAAKRDLNSRQHCHLSTQKSVVGNSVMFGQFSRHFGQFWISTQANRKSSMEVDAHTHKESPPKCFYIASLCPIKFYNGGCYNGLLSYHTLFIIKFKHSWACLKIVLLWSGSQRLVFFVLST